MITIHPFKAWRPEPENVEEVACVPYDVINTEEARELAENRPKSFLHVIRPEIGLKPGVDLYDDRVYGKGAENLKRFIREGVLKQPDPATVYLYQQKQDDHVQTGLYACVSVKDYDEDRILKHELTRPDKEDDRTRHIIEQQAHAEPVMLTYRPNDRIHRQIQQTMEIRQPLYAFTAVDGVEHRVWKLEDPRELIEGFRDIDRLYVADGHHRCKSASRAAEKLRKNPETYTDEEFEFFPAVIFPMDELRILAYNRLVHQVPPRFLEQLSQQFDLKEDSAPEPGEKGSVSLYIDGRWYGLQLPRPEDGSSVEQLDVARLHRYLLQPLLGIEDQRRDKNVSFVGGIRGTRELEKRVNEGSAQLAINMYPTSIQELMAVSDEGELMPPKSTWFEPKLRSGLLVHTFNRK